MIIDMNDRRESLTHEYIVSRNRRYRHDEVWAWREQATRVFSLAKPQYLMALSDADEANIRGGA